jgi:hypothetical protein
MKRPTKPKLNKTDNLVLSEYEWNSLTFEELINKAKELNIPFEELYFDKEYDYDNCSELTIRRKFSTEEEKKKYDERMEQYRKDLIAYYEYKAKQLKEVESCGKTEQEIK